MMTHRTAIVLAIAVIAACARPRVGTDAQCGFGWQSSLSGDSTVVACVPPGFTTSNGSPAQWNRGGDSSWAVISFTVDTNAATSEPWPPRLRDTPNCTADCIHVDSVVAHTDTVGKAVAQVETGIERGGFAGFVHRPAVVGGWLQSRFRVRANGSAFRSTTLDTLRAILRTARVVERH